MVILLGVSPGISLGVSFVMSLGTSLMTSLCFGNLLDICVLQWYVSCLPGEKIFESFQRR